MKKIRALLVAVALASCTQAFALKSTPDLAIGVQATSVNLDTYGAMLTTHLPGIPLFIGVGANFYHQLSGGTELTATVDYWLAHTSSGKINFYAGLGLCGTMATDRSWYNAGLRLPLGLQSWPLGNEAMEALLEVAPAWTPLVDGETVWDEFQAQVAFGIRFWFDM